MKSNLYRIKLLRSKKKKKNLRELVSEDFRAINPAITNLST